MRNYRHVAEIGYAIIAREVKDRIQTEYDIKEIRFVKVPEKNVMYNQYTLREGKNIPSIDGFEFAGAANETESLVGIVNACALPEEIRIIKPGKKAMRMVLIKQ